VRRLCSTVDQGEALRGFSPGCRQANQMPEDMNPDEGGWFVGLSGEKPSTRPGELNKAAQPRRCAQRSGVQ